MGVAVVDVPEAATDGRDRIVSMDGSMVQAVTTDLFHMNRLVR